MVFLTLSYMRTRLHAALAGLSITYALQVTVFMNWVVRMGTLGEAQMSSGTYAAWAVHRRMRLPTPRSHTHRHAVERISFYSKVQTEAAWIVAARRPPSGWPAQPTIIFVCVRSASVENLRSRGRVRGVGRGVWSVGAWARGHVGAWARGRVGAWARGRGRLPSIPNMAYYAA